jgi:NADPH2:quinone reductase
MQLVELPDPEPGPGEIRVSVAYSGVDPSDVKSRASLRARALPFPRVVPHSDGSGRIDRVGDGVDPARVGQRVWVWNAARGREVGEEAAAKEVRAALARARETCGKQRQWQALGERAACPP